MNASVFTSYKYTMNLLLPGSGAEPNLWQITAAGSASGVFTSCVGGPPGPLGHPRPERSFDVD